MGARMLGRLDFPRLAGRPSELSHFAPKVSPAEKARIQCNFEKRDLATLRSTRLQIALGSFVRDWGVGG